MNKRHAGRWAKPAASMALALSLAQLAGCSSIGKAIGVDNPIDYKSASSSDVEPLNIPPDLTQAASDPRYRAPDAGGATSFSQYQQQSKDAASAVATGKSPSGVLPQRDDMHIERDGDLRWLVIDHPPEQIFPKLVDFWTSVGFTLNTNNPQAGLLETDWAENRAKIPDSWLHDVLGTIFNEAYDSGERERFRTRVERVGDHTEIFLSHQQMTEKMENSGPSALAVWVPGQEDAGLNAAMLARMMVFLGTDADRARQLLAQAQVSPAKVDVQSVQTAQGASELTIGEAFDRAWRRVGVALDSGGFSVQDRDRNAGDYFVRYLDTDTGVRPEDPNIFSRYLFGVKPAVAPQYRVHLSGSGSSGAQTQVTVLDSNGARDTSPTAQRMLGVLKDKMQ
ncbi:MAG TPA: outer membrane protein assembly factor BamC [Bordetella sp.]